MTRLTICFVTREYPPETGYGGIGSYYADLAHLLTERGFRVVVISEALTKESFIDDQGIHVYRVRPKWTVSDRRILWRFGPYWTGYRLAVASKLQQIVRDYSVDIIETPELYAQTFFFHILKLSKPSLVIRMHSGTAIGLHYNRQQPIARFYINMMLEQWSLRHAALITAPTQALVDKSRQLGLFLPHGRIQIIPNPVNTDIFSPDQTTPRDKSTVLFVGRLEWWKGPDIIIDALPQILATLPHVTFRFVGNDSDLPGKHSFREMLKGKVPEALRGSVEFLPAVPRNELPEIYRHATIAVIPSRWESFGYVCAEAMACGTPVIVHNRGGLPEIVENHGAGVIIEPEKPDVLAATVIELINDPSRREQIGALGRRRIREYCGAQEITDKLAQLYFNLSATSNKKY